jgi:2-(1,2-epoxy-1,2-dihydrophenyl)acetyl-CoA isomerase
MKNNLAVDNEMFKGKTVSNIAVLEIKNNSLYQLTDLDLKKSLFDYLDVINNNDNIGALIIKAPPRKSECEAYIELYRKILQIGEGRDYQTYSRENEPFVEHISLARFCNAVNQFVLKIVQFNKFVIHTDSGEIISPFMNLSLACDYRIVAENSNFKNSYLFLGLVPKGGSAVFLSRLVGFQKAYKILLSANGIMAGEAKDLGIVDEVVPLDKLFERALKVGQSYAGLPASSIAGIKKLMHVSIKELEKCLESENEQLFRIINNAMFHNKLKDYIAVCN